MNNVHDDAPVLLHSRWALSYLRGPLTREQIEALSRVGARAAPTAVAAAVVADPTPPAAARPVLPPGIVERFLRVRQPLGGAALAYAPALLSRARLHFAAAKPKVDVWRDAVHLARLPADGAAVDPWANAVALDPREVAVDGEPAPQARFLELPAAFARPKAFAAARQQLADFLHRTARVRVHTAPSRKETSQPDETEGDFRARLRQGLREARDLEVGRIRDRYAARVQRLQDRIRNAEQKVEVERVQASQSTLGAAVALGTGILGAIFGRKVASVANVGRAGSVLRGAGRVKKERADIAHAEEDLQALRAELVALQGEVEEAAAAAAQALDVDAVTIETAEVAPRKADLDVYELVLAWVPCVEQDGVLRELR
jgi:hypothetical protein